MCWEYSNFIISIGIFQNDFTSEDFVHMNAPLLYKMLKSKTEYPLHSAIKLQREDVVFLYLIEFTAEVGHLFVLFIELWLGIELFWSTSENQVRDLTCSF